MNILNEMVDNWDITEIKQEMDSVLEQYKNLINFTQLNEGVLDDLSDDLIQKVSEIQKRIDVIQKARNIVSKLEKSGEFSKEDVKKHRERLTKNKKALSSALKRTSKKMDEFEKTAKKELDKKSDSVSNAAAYAPETENVDVDVSMEEFGRQAPFLLKKADEGGINYDEINYDKYEDTIELLQDAGLIDKSGRITQKGKAVREKYKQSRQRSSGQLKQPDPYNDDSGYGDAIDDLQGLDF